jgi:hypothetical protein
VPNKELLPSFITGASLSDDWQAWSTLFGPGKWEKILIFQMAIIVK